MGMGSADVRLLAALWRRPLASWQALAGDLHVDRTTVARRVAALGRSGVLDGFVGLPHPAVFGATRWLALVPHPEPTWEQVRAVSTAMGHSIVGRRLALLCYAPASIEHSVAEALGREPERCFPLADPPVTPPGGRLSRLETRVMAELVGEPRATSVRLGAAAGVNRRTAERVRARLVEGCLLRVEPVIRHERAEGRSLFSVEVTGPRAADAPLRDLCPDLWLAERSAGSCLWMGSSPNLHEALALPDAIAAVQGIEKARLVMQRGGGYDVERLRRWLTEGFGDHPGL